MLFKNIVLNNNNKLKSINKTQFITSVVNNLNMRLIENTDEEKIILQDFQILNKNMWPIEVDIRFGENEIRRICDRFLINKDKSLRGMRAFVDENEKIDDINKIEDLNDLHILINTFPCSTAECERGFSLMNNICTELRSKLTIQNISHLMFINVNGPPINKWNPETYVKSWITSHRTAEDNRSRKVNMITDLDNTKIKLWDLL